MRVLLLNQFFYPDVAAVAQLMTDLAEDLTADGVQVSVLCGNTRYSRQQNMRPGKGTLPGSIRVHRVPSLNLPGRTSIVHALNYMSFHAAALLRAVFLPRHDCVIAFTNPPLIGLAAWMLKCLRGIRFVQVVEDIYPDVAVKLGFLGYHSTVARVADRVSVFLLRHSDRVVVLGDSMKSVLVAKGVSVERIVTIPNWADGTEVSPIQKAENWFLKRHGLEDKFVVEYSGHMGEAHDFVTILETANALKEHEKIVFLFIGGGPRWPEIDSFRKSHGLENVMLLPYQDRRDLKYSLSAADISLISLREELESVMFPCKVYGIMAAGRPFIYIGGENGEVGQIAQVAGCGFAVRSGDVDLLQSLLVDLSRDSSRLCKAGAAARRFFLDNFDRKLATARYHTMLKEVVGERG